MPKVSVIIPVYNEERYLAECLDSILQQTLTDLEVLCVDAGSTDSSPSILQCDDPILFRTIALQSSPVINGWMQALPEIWDWTEPPASIWLFWMPMICFIPPCWKMPIRKQKKTIQILSSMPHSSWT